MDKDELIKYLSSRFLNSKSNNYIFTNFFDDLKLINDIPNLSSISFYEFDYEIEYAINVKIDFKRVSVHDVFIYILDYLKQLNMIETKGDYNLKFNTKYDILKFQKLLRMYGKVLQLICYNLESFDEDEQKLFNELYFYNSPFYSVISFVKENFKTYFLTQDRVLDDRENYTKIELVNNRLKRIKFKK